MKRIDLFDVKEASSSNNLNKLLEQLLKIHQHFLISFLNISNKDVLLGLKL